MSSSKASTIHRLWSRILRNAAALARLRVLECLRHRTCHDVVGKGAGGDITKRFDVVAEQTTVGYLERFTSFTLVSEEAGIKRIGSNPEGFLIMDPIDGSTNLSHNIPFACLAIAYATEMIFDAVEVAVVLDLFSGKCYHATKGSGAFRNQERIYPSDANPLEDSLVGIDAEVPPVSLMKSLEEIDEEHVKYTRHFGANAMELCFVADGTLDGFIDLRGVFRGTDLAAASLILQESGAVLVDPKGVQIKGKCSNDARYAYIAARDNVFAQRLLALVSGNKK